MSDEVEVKPIFDVKRPMTTKIPSPDGIKLVKYRFPTDQECCAHVRKQITIIRQIGRGKSKADASSGSESDLILMKSLMNGDGVELTQKAASSILGAALRARVQSIECTGAGYTVELKVPGAVTTHRVRMPSTDEIENYRESSISDVQGRYNMTEVRAFLEPSGVLYDALSPETEGYAGPVPIVHKAAVVAAIRAEIDALNEEADPEV